MKDLDYIQKLSVLNCVFQTIYSAEGNIDEERDYDAIKLALDTLGFTSVHAWDTALKLDSQDSFIHITTLNESQKLMFQELLMQVAAMAGSVNLRNICAKHIIQFCFK